MKPTFDKRHGGPWDRGSADRYYGRSRHPHYFVGGTGHGEPVTDLTPDEIAAYNDGFDNETDRKDWGDE